MIGENKNSLTEEKRQLLIAQLSWTYSEIDFQTSIIDNLEKLLNKYL